MIAVVDIGNTFAKIAFFEANRLVRYHEKLSVEEMYLLATKVALDYVIISDVSGQTKDIFTAKNVFRLTPQLPIPLKNRYASPHSLGMDRLAAAVGAKSMFPQQNCLVVDAGTCMTVDVLTAAGEFLGGSISAGLSMRLRAMHEQTARLPLLDGIADEVDFVGNTTQNCMASGTLYGMVAEIVLRTFYFLDIKTTTEKVNIVLCGGDAPRLAQELKKFLPNSSIIDEPKLVILGLYEILKFNL